MRALRTSSLTVVSLLTLTAGVSGVSPAAAAAPVSSASQTSENAAFSRSLRTLSRATCDTYRAQRDALVKQLRADATLRQALNARVATNAASESSFDADIVAAILAEHLRDQPRANLDSLQGLSAEHYLKRRRPRVGAVNELERRQVPMPLLYERLAFERDLALAQVSTPADFPPKYAKEAAEFIAKERAGHVEALVHAIGSSGHPLAALALIRHLRSARGSDRATTALALGATKKPIALPVLVEEIAGDAEDIQQTATIGIGHLRLVEGSEALRALTTDGRAAVRLAAIRAIGAAATVRATDAGQSRRLEIALEALIPLLDRKVGDGVTQSEMDAVVQTLSQLPSPTTTARLRASQSPLAKVVLDRLDRKARRLR